MRFLPTASLLLFASAVITLGQQNFSRATAPVEVAAAPLAAESFEVDGGHSSVLFRIKHMKVAYFYGRFNDVSGTILLDEEDPTKSTASITIKAASVDSNSEKRDEHITGPDFLDAKQFPELKFTSKSVKRDGAVWKMTGDLEMRGTRKSVSLDFEKTGEAAGRGGGTVAGFHSRFTIDRTEWGMDYMAGGPLGNEIEMTVSLEAKRP